MIGPFKPTLGGFRWVYVCIDKFSKWIEYKPLIQAIAKKAAKLLDDIIHKFSLPNSIIINLGPHLSAVISWISATKDASRSSTFRWLTLGLMDKLNAPTA
jgi:hypothetical protein